MSRQVVCFYCDGLEEYAQNALEYIGNLCPSISTEMIPHTDERATLYGVARYPTFYLVKHGVFGDSWIGKRNFSELEEWIREIRWVEE